MKLIGVEILGGNRYYEIGSKLKNKTDEKEIEVSVDDIIRTRHGCKIFFSDNTMVEYYHTALDFIYQR